MRGSWNLSPMCASSVFFFFQAEDGIRDLTVTGVQTCALPISDETVWPAGRSRWRSGLLGVAGRIVHHRRGNQRRRRNGANLRFAKASLGPKRTDAWRSVPVLFISCDEYLRGLISRLPKDLMKSRYSRRDGSDEQYLTPHSSFHLWRSLGSGGPFACRAANVRIARLVRRRCRSWTALVDPAACCNREKADRHRCRPNRQARSA